MGAVGPAFTNLNEGLLEDSVSPEEINEVLQRLDTPEISVEDMLIDDVASTAADDDDESLADGLELDLSPGELDKTLDPVRVYMREMGLVPLLTREQEVSIAKRIEGGEKRAQKAITRSPIAVAELLKIGEELEAGILSIRDVIAFSDQSETEEEDKGEEYLHRTIAGIQNVRKLYRRALREFEH